MAALGNSYNGYAREDNIGKGMQGQETARRRHPRALGVEIHKKKVGSNDVPGAGKQTLERVGRDRLERL